MSATDIKTRHDKIIRLMVECGSDSARIAAATGTSVPFITRRAIYLGLYREMVRNSFAARDAARRKKRARLQPSHGGRQSAIWQAVIGGRRADDTTPEIIRILKRHRPSEVPACIDPENIVACLHQRGLTLDDIHETVGIPPVEAVAAIRRAHHGAHP